jgi:hypothetical protein
MQSRRTRNGFFPSLARPADPSLSPISSPRLHVFDVDRENGALKVWERILDGEREKSSRPPSIKDVDSDNLDAQLDSTDHLKRDIHTLNPREKHFRLSAPPVISAWKTDTVTGYPIPVIGTEPELDELARETTPLLRTSSPSKQDDASALENLTLEGRRQVCYFLLYAKKKSFSLQL